MSVQTQFQFLNANDPEYQRAINGTAEERREWEEDNGSIEDRPGADIYCPNCPVIETEDEYGGWIISISDIPKDCTHIVVYRS